MIDYFAVGGNWAFLSTVCAERVLGGDVGVGGKAGRRMHGTVTKGI